MTTPPDARAPRRAATAHAALSRPLVPSGGRSAASGDHREAGRQQDRERDALAGAARRPPRGTTQHEHQEHRLLDDERSRDGDPQRQRSARAARARATYDAARSATGALPSHHWSTHRAASTSTATQPIRRHVGIPAVMRQTLGAGARASLEQAHQPQRVVGPPGAGVRAAVAGAVGLAGRLDPQVGVELPAGDDLGRGGRAARPIGLHQLSPLV